MVLTCPVHLSVSARACLPAPFPPVFLLGPEEDLAAWVPSLALALAGLLEFSVKCHSRPWPALLGADPVPSQTSCCPSVTSMLWSQPRALPPRPLVAPQPQWQVNSAGLFEDDHFLLMWRPSFTCTSRANVAFRYKWLSNLNDFHTVSLSQYKPVTSQLHTSLPCEVNEAS